MNQLGDSLKSKGPSEPLPWDSEMKVFFCSRTHTQLSQLVSELQRVKMPSGLPPETGDSHTGSCSRAEDEVFEEFKHLSLGSRKHLCINPQVNSLGNNIAINEKCQEILQNGGGCQYLPDDKDDTQFHEFRDRALAKVRDIEDLGRLGREMKVCPYYGSRSAVDLSEVSPTIQCTPFRASTGAYAMKTTLAFQTRFRRSLTKS